MFCAQCGTGIPDNAAFCPSCGASQPVAAGGTEPSAPRVAAQPQMPTVCPSCGTTVQPGRRFCTHCGRSMTSGARPRPARSGAVAGPLGAAEMVMAGGFGLAIIGTLLEWASFGPQGVSGWNGDSRFRVAEWLGVTAPIDAAIIAIAAGLGAYLLLGPRFGLQAPSIPFGPSAAGALITAVGILEWVYVDDVGQGVVDPGLGIYAVIIAGLVVSFARFITGMKLSG